MIKQTADAMVEVSHSHSRGHSPSHGLDNVGQRNGGNDLTYVFYQLRFLSKSFMIQNQIQDFVHRVAGYVSVRWRRLSLQTLRMSGGNSPPH